MATTSADAMRRYNGPALFERGFRPFFLGAAIFAALAVPAWIWVFVSGTTIHPGLSMHNLHVHEMVFGYPSAVIAGFLLTATPNWTGRLPVTGAPLAALFLVWVAGRVAMLTPFFGYAAVATIDVAFLVVFAGLIWREIVTAGNYRNIPVCALITLFAATNIVFHILQATGADPGIAIRGALGLVAMLIMLIGGRIIPSFTRNWLAKQKNAKLPVPFSSFDRLAISAGILAICFWTIQPDWIGTAWFAALAACGHLVRMLRWRGWATFSEPLVAILHAAYLWLPIWFGLLAVSTAQIGPFSKSAAMHALTAGTIGTMTLAVMSRAILGHSGRPLSAGLGTVAIYLLAILAAVVRIAADILPMSHNSAMILSAGCWSAAFGLFVILYGPLCLKRRMSAAT
ncbi:MAG: NnrS family protein [Rhizobiaceae bacterium]